MLSEPESFPPQLVLCHKEPADFLAVFPTRADLILCDTREQLGELDRAEQIAACMPDVERLLLPLGHAVIVCEPELRATRALLSGVGKTHLEGRWLIWDEPMPMGPFPDKSALLLLLKRPENDIRHECLQDGYVFRRCPTYSHLANNLIRVATRKGGLVVDPCTLTAEALITAHELRRHAVGASPCERFLESLRTSGAFRSV